MKKIIAAVVFFLVLIYSVSPLKVFTVEETGRISLKTTAQDPDNDSVSYSYSEPLDASGEWQTTYGDAGSYNTSVTVSDGSQQTTERILIIVTQKQEKPVIGSFSPDQILLSIDEGKRLLFEVNATDLNNDQLTYQWLFDGQVLGNKGAFELEAGYDQQGHHSVELRVSDGTDSVTKAWNVQIKDVDLDRLFDDIRDFSAIETDLVSLSLSAFSGFGLQYGISEPIGNDNLWQTGYDDSGKYEITLFARARGYERMKTITLTVENKDRPPLILLDERRTVDENEQVELLMDAQDPDEDPVFFSADNLPQGAYFDGTSLVWQPSFDEVQKHQAFDYFLDNFRVLSKTRTVDIIATSNDSRSSKQVKIVVRDVNQPFIWEPMPVITVQEGEEIRLEPKYSDPDNDRVRFSYSGYMVTDKKKTNFNDAGHYVVKIEASDGYYTQTQFVDVIVENVNQRPQFDTMPTASIAEGQSLRLRLDASDADGERLSFSSSELPDNARIEGNELLWTPSFEVSATESKITIPITVSDGLSEVSQDAHVTVLHVNRPPKILESSNTQVAFVGETVVFEIKAMDEDNDLLQYTWDFGLFEKYVGESVHARQFSSAGDKEISVVVSDGKSEVKKTWHVKVI